MTLSITAEAAALPPAKLVDSGFGFMVHPLNLSARERSQYDNILAESLGKVVLSGAVEPYRKKHALEIFEHGVRTASLGLGTGIRLGLPGRDLVIGTIGMILHDMGRLDDEILEISRSAELFDDRPEKRDKMRDHTWLGAVMLSRDFATLGPNVPFIADGHHGLQGDREPYGLRGHIIGRPETDGYVPDIDPLIGIIALADPFDPMTVPHEVSRRPYREGRRPDYAKALNVLHKVDAPRYVLNAMLDVALPKEVLQQAA